MVGVGIKFAVVIPPDDQFLSSAHRCPFQSFPNSADHAGRGGACAVISDHRGYVSTD